MDGSYLTVGSTAILEVGGPSLDWEYGEREEVVMVDC